MSCHDIAVPCEFCLSRLILGSTRSYAAQTRWVGEAWANLDFVSNFLVSCFRVSQELRCSKIQHSFYWLYSITSSFW